MGDLVASILSFTVTLVLLIIYSGFDIRERKVPNQVMLIGCVVGIVVNVISGHFAENLPLHVFAILFAAPISYILFRLGAFGGADVKALISVVLISPGFEFAIGMDPLAETIFATGIELIFMLALGYHWWSLAKRHNEDTLHPPLIPMLLIGYAFVASFVTVAYFL